jgi:hypothetical protein
METLDEWVTRSHEHTAEAKRRLASGDQLAAIDQSLAALASMQVAFEMLREECDSTLQAA